jgi:hypothetical protein
MVVALALVALLVGARLDTAAEENTKSQGLSLFDIKVSPATFNPSRGDKVTLNYQLSRSAKVTVKVFDPDLELVRVLAQDASRKTGANREVWDGRDSDGNAVPNEAYFFTLEAEDSSSGESVFYDPITFSGGEPFDIAGGHYQREAGTLTYMLSQPSRVLIRIGIPGSALLKTLADWEPRPAGEITEYWNGKDEDNLIDIWKNPNYRILVSYFTLPEASVIGFGNDKVDYRTYKGKLVSTRPKKVERPAANRRKLSPHFLTSRIKDRSFKIQFGFPELEKTGVSGFPVVKDQVLVRVDVREADREVILGQQYEIILFVDGVYFAEEERGYVPFNFPWELKGLAEGEHVLTVNLVTFNDQFGVGSRKVKVMK